MSFTAFKFTPLSLLTLTLMSGFAINHASVNATIVASHIQPSTLSPPFAPVTPKYWGQDNRLGNFGDVYQNFGNWNHDQGYFMLMVQQPNQYWYYPGVGSSTNPWWWYLGNDLSVAKKITQNLKATLKSGRYKMRPWSGKLGDQYIDISRASPKIDVYSLKVAGAESSAFPGVSQENINWKYLETIDLSQPASTFSHSATFPQLAFDVDYSSAASWSQPSFQTNFYLSAQLEHKTLMNRFNRHLPAGRGVSILQAESSQSPDSSGFTVQRIFQSVAANSHSTQVFNTLSKPASYPLLKTKYIGVSPELRIFQTATTEDLRNFNASASPNNWYPKQAVNGIALTPPNLVNISNTNGGSSTATVRQFDRMAERNRMLPCTAQNGSVSSGNWTTSGNIYNGVVVDQPNGRDVNDAGTKLNDHGVRQKPDLVSFAHDGAASSFSTPTACTIAAMMLERANVDPAAALAQNPQVLKALMMAGADRFSNFRRGSWARESDSMPLSNKYGAGNASANGSYMILDAGRQPFGHNTQSRGWDFGKDLSPGATRSYLIGVQKPQRFSAVIAWMRRISDDGNNSDLPNIDLYLKDSNGTVVAKSISTSNNVELIDLRMQPGQYTLEVIRNASDTSAPTDFGLAWTGRDLVPTPILSGVTAGSNYMLSWRTPDGDQANYSYWVVVANDASFQSEVTSFGTGSTSATLPLSYADKFIKIFGLPVYNYGTQYPGDWGVK